MATYDNAAASSITDDLKIFFGTIADVKAVAAAGKVVSRKWYLAWDTGEFFIGSGTKKLLKFGGSNNDMSKSDVQSLIDQYSKPELTAIKGQIAAVQRQLNLNNSAVSDLSAKLESEISKLNNDTEQYIQEQVKVVLANAESITYSKSKIDSMLLEVQAALEERSYDKHAVDLFLANQKEETEAYAANLSVWHLTGDEISALVAAGKTKAICLCSEKSSESSTNVYLQGHLYSINKMIATDITAGGGGSSSYIAPIITLTVGGESSVQILTGSSYAKSTTFDYAVSNPENISSDYLTLTQNSGSVTDYVRLSSTIPVAGSGTYSTITSLSNPKPGTYLFTMAGTDSKNAQIYGSFSVVVRSPIYHGHSAKAIIGDPSETPSDIATDAALIKSFPYSTGETADGKYTFSNVADGDYLWFFIPEEIPFDPADVYLSGFSAKFNTAHTTMAISLGSVSENYKCYRSVNALQATDSVTLSVSGN